MSATTTEQQELAAGTWSVDPVHSRIGFEVKHLGISTFRGNFGRYKGRIVTSAGALTGVEGTIEVASIDVDDAQLAGHLGSEDFFAAEKNPEARFASTSVESAGDGRYSVRSSSPTAARLIRSPPSGPMPTPSTLTWSSSGRLTPRRVS